MEQSRFFHFVSTDMRLSSLVEPRFHKTGNYDKKSKRLSPHREFPLLKRYPDRRIL